MKPDLIINNMSFTNPFENKEFDHKYSSVKRNIENYLKLNKIELDEDISIDSLISWNDFHSPRIIHATANCPEELKDVVVMFIQKEFPLQ